MNQLLGFLMLLGITFLWLRLWNANGHQASRKPLGASKTPKHRSFRLTKNPSESELAMQEEEEIANALESIGKSIRGIGLIALLAWMTGG